MLKKKKRKTLKRREHINTHFIKPVSPLHQSQIRTLQHKKITG